MFKCAEIWANKGIMSMKWSFALLFGAIAMPALAQSEQVTPTNCDASAFERPEAISVDMSTFAELKSAARFVFIPSQYDLKLYQSEKRYSQAEVQLFIDTNYVCSVGNKDGYLLIPSMVTSGGSGLFYYIALYKQQPGYWELEDEMFLGDRIELKSLTYNKDMFKVEYAQHSVEQAMVEEPKEFVSRKFLITDNKLTEQTN